MYIDAVSGYFDRLSIVDVGPMLEEGAARPGLLTLAKHPKVDYVGFDADREKVSELARQFSQNGMLFNYQVVADGGPKTLYRRKPDNRIYFQAYDPAGLEPLVFSDEGGPLDKEGEVVSVKLDELVSKQSVDYLKISQSGAELEILNSATKLLAEVAVVEVEVSLMPIWETGASCSDVGKLMQDLGFIVHKIIPIRGVNYKPWIQPPGMSQDLAATMVFVRDYRTAKDLSDRQLITASVILEEIYQSGDLASFYVQVIDKRDGTDSDIFKIHGDRAW